MVEQTKIPQTSPIISSTGDSSSLVHKTPLHHYANISWMLSPSQTKQFHHQPRRQIQFDFRIV